MARMDRIGTCATTIKIENGVTSVRYHSTDVFVLDPVSRSVTLDSGRWYTTTTKTRINQACNEYGVPIQVYQKSKKWFVSFYTDDNRPDMPFVDGMTIQY